MTRPAQGMTRVPVVTIDGPVGSGKGTVAGLLAEGLGWNFLDSGALYRLVALSALEAGVSDEQAAARLAEDLQAEFQFRRGTTRVFLAGREVTLDIRREAVSEMASRLAIMPSVRAALVDRQRSFRKAPGLVADGRDMGTVIFPDAELKIFLTASVEVRARRRYKQLKEKGESVNLPRLFGEIEARDKRDSSREIAPLKPAEDAFIIDSSELNINEVVQEVRKLVDEIDIYN